MRGCGEELEALFKDRAMVIPACWNEACKADQLSAIATAPASKLNSLVCKDLNLHNFVDIAVR